MRRARLAAAAIVLAGGAALAGSFGRAAATDAGPDAGPHAAADRAQCAAGGPSEMLVPGGRFTMGAQRAYPEEAPPRQVDVAAFWMDTREVTNAQFAAFVAATGYVTEAERTPDPAAYPDIAPEKLVPGAAVFVGAEAGDDPRRWWRFVPGASWKHPAGPASSIAGRDHFPVVQVTWADAQAYATWRGRALPSEAQWEYASRGGGGGTTYAWGEEETPAGKAQANHWQGPFPAHDAGVDGHAGLAPAGCYPPNAYGLYDMIGNVWEWTTSPWTPNHATPAPAGDAQPLRVLKGGSYLCASDYCFRYRPPARQAGDAGMGSSHTGFRTIRAAE